MERRLNKKIADHLHNFKSELAGKIQSIQTTENQDTVLELLNFVYEFDTLQLDKDDFLKRKRVKSTVPVYERCFAKRANGEQCTRRKKDDCQYCGTHSKGTPHGIVSENENNTNTTKKVEVSAIDIKGIVYYLDNTDNVYDTEDILANKKNPRVIAKYVKNGDNYNIPELFS